MRILSGMRLGKLLAGASFTAAISCPINYALQVGGIGGFDGPEGIVVQTETDLVCRQVVQGMIQSVGREPGHGIKMEVAAYEGRTHCRGTHGESRSE